MFQSASSNRRFGAHVAVMLRQFARLAFALGVIGCAKSAPTAASVPPANLAGSWTGGLFATASGTGALRLTLTQQLLSLLPPGKGYEVDLRGTWSTSFPNPANDDSGTVSGSAWSASVGVELTLTDSGGCAFALTGTRTGVPAMSGSFRTKSCAVADSGTFGVSKE